MSYILDALRKADAERERDPARGIHAQPAAAPAEAPRRVAPFVAGAAALVVVGAGAAWLLRPAATPGAPVIASAPAAVPVAVPVAAPAVPVAPAPAPLAQAPVAAPVVIPIAAAVSPPAPPPLPPRAPERVAPKAAPAVVAKAAPAAAAVPAPVAVPAAAPVAAHVPAVVAPAPAAAAADRVLAYAELPQEVQRELPKLQISGGVHSQNAAQRMLIVGGQVMNEGAEIAPGVFIEQIRPRTAVLKFRGYRYSVGY